MSLICSFFYRYSPWGSKRQSDGPPFSMAKTFHRQMFPNFIIISVNVRQPQVWCSNSLLFFSLAYFPANLSSVIHSSTSHTPFLSILLSHYNFLTTVPPKRNPFLDSIWKFLPTLCGWILDICGVTSTSSCQRSLKTIDILQYQFTFDFYVLGHNCTKFAYCITF